MWFYYVGFSGWCKAGLAKVYVLSRDIRLFFSSVAVILLVETTAKNNVAVMLYQMGQVGIVE